MGWKIHENKDKNQNGEENHRKETARIKKGEERWIKSIKEEYKQCREALQKETYDKNKAEVLYKVLKDKIEIGTEK